MASAAPKTVDIEEIVKDWADDYFRRKTCRDDRKMRELLDQDWIRTEVDWRRVLFDHKEPVFTPEPPKPGTGKLKETCLFNTTYTNKTDHTQTYTFRAERCSRSSCTVAIEEGYTQGVDVSVKLSLPQNILEANAGYHREVNICTVNEQTTEEELTWGVDSQIKVEPRHTAEAKLMMTEEEFSGKFTMETLIRGIVKVNFYNVKDNNNYIKSVETDICRLVQEQINNKSPRIPLKCQTFGIKDKLVFSITNGTCKFKYGLKQHIEVDQYPLTPKKLNGV